MVQLSTTMEQTRETQLAQLYDVLGFRRVIARYDVLSTLHETGQLASSDSGDLNFNVTRIFHTPPCQQSLLS